MARKAALAAKADALRARMRESHLANFRMEAKRRCGPCIRRFQCLCVRCALRCALRTHGCRAPVQLSFFDNLSICNPTMHFSQIYCTFILPSAMQPCTLWLMGPDPDWCKPCCCLIS